MTHRMPEPTTPVPDFRFRRIVLDAGGAAVSR